MSQSFHSTPLWCSHDIQKATKGSVLVPFSATNVVIDSREVKGGELFIALKGPKFDGHDYVEQALEKGAAGALVDHVPEALRASSKSLPLIVVTDALEALNALARAARARSLAQIIGITGSFGKTSIKDALRHVLEKKGKTLATERSFNNHWGLPLTLARLHPDHRYAVIEMGMNGLGEISAHSKLTKPHVALINNTGNAHIGKLGTLENIIQAKSEIFDGLSEGGTAILWEQDKAFDIHKEKALSHNASVLSFGETSEKRAMDFKATYEMKKTGLDIHLVCGKEVSDVSLSTFATHWARNCAAVAACLKAVSVPWSSAIKALNSFSFPSGRGNIVMPSNGLLIIDESYNAAPTTMAYALKTLLNIGEITGRRIIAILGDMLELGEESRGYHRDVAKLSGFSHISQVYCCGPEMESLYNILLEEQKGGWAKDPIGLIKTVLTKAKPDDIYLIKGSRGQWSEKGRMAAFVEALADHHF